MSHVRGSWVTAVTLSPYYIFLATEGGYVGHAWGTVVAVLAHHSADLPGAAQHVGSVTGVFRVPPPTA